MRLKFIFTLAVVCGFMVSESYGQQTAKITSSGIGYLEYLPSDYNNNANDYPIVIFLHGVGEKGATSTDPTTLKNSLQKVANVGLPKYVKYGQKYPFIIISPQLKNSYTTWPANYVIDVLNHVKKYLRINERRIYITGLSLGGFGTWTTLGAYPHIFAAAVPICSGGNALAKACAIASENVALWGFHGTGDHIVSYTKTTSMINAINACTPKPSPLAKTTLFSGLGHNIWDKVYKETTAINWMLGFTNGSTTEPGSVPTTNNPPVVSAGSDKTITLPATQIYLYGSASDADGSIASVRWTKTSGPVCGLSGTSQSRLNAYNLVAGTYTFRFAAKDNDGATRYDDVTLTVNSSTTSNIAPIANAGNDRSTTSSSIILYGSGSDRDGRIVSYRWTKFGGAAATLTNANTSSVTVSGLRAGKYYMRLTVTDDKGATDYDNMLIVVGSSSATAYNISPVSNAGPDRRFDTDINYLKVYGKGTDRDGRIVSYKWAQYGGPDLTLQNTTSPTLSVSGLDEGKYYLKLTVKDDDGAVDHDNMLIVVNES